MPGDRREERVKEFDERVVSIDRVSYTVAGGRRMRFRALVVIGNRQGRVGMGIAKAGEVQAAVQKAVAAAKKRMITVPIVRETIPHAIEMKYGSGRILLKPAPAGTSVIAGGSIRAVIELAGIKNILSKRLGSNNKINNVMATLEALRRLRRPQAAASAPPPETEAAGTGLDHQDPSSPIAAAALPQAPSGPPQSQSEPIARTKGTGSRKKPIAPSKKRAKKA
ncbi:30S ribosomal protein S5 [Candidatus Berkelbacteria bacterium]|nr:30S ribosomal protein S5 [Candidatus Berkelbacteria bacterium]